MFCHRLWKVVQSAINRPIWSHWLCRTDICSSTGNVEVPHRACSTRDWPTTATTGTSLGPSTRWTTGARTWPRASEGRGRSAGSRKRPSWGSWSRSTCRGIKISKKNFFPNFKISFFSSLKPTMSSVPFKSAKERLVGVVVALSSHPKSK